MDIAVVIETQEMEWIGVCTGGTQRVNAGGRSPTIDLCNVNQRPQQRPYKGVRNKAPTSHTPAYYKRPGTLLTYNYVPVMHIYSMYRQYSPIMHVQAELS